MTSESRDFVSQRNSDFILRCKEGDFPDLDPVNRVTDSSPIETGSFRLRKVTGTKGVLCRTDELVGMSDRIKVTSGRVAVLSGLSTTCSFEQD